MRTVLLALLSALALAAIPSLAAAAKAAPAVRDPEALRIIEAVARHFERSALVEAEVTLVAEGVRARVRRQAAVGVELQSAERHLLIRGDTVWTRPDASADWTVDKAPVMGAAEGLVALDLSSVPLTAAALRARAAEAASVRLLGALPDEDGCAIRGVLLEQAGRAGVRAVQLELRVCADDLHPVGARLRWIGPGAPEPREDAIYTLQADGQLPDPTLR